MKALTFFGFIAIGNALPSQLLAGVVLEEMTQYLSQDERFATEVGLPLFAFDETSLTPEEKNGAYFKFHTFTSSDKQSVGLLIPIADQTFQDKWGDRKFSAYLVDGELSLEATATLQEKIQNLRRLKSFGGPTLHAMARLSNHQGIRVGLLVAKLEDNSFLNAMKEPDFDPAMIKLYFDLMNRFLDRHWLPLDAHRNNMMMTKNGLIPYDVTLKTPDEIISDTERNEVAKLSAELKIKKTKRVATELAVVRRNEPDPLDLSYCAESLARLNGAFSVLPKHLNLSLKP